MRIVSFETHRDLASAPSGIIRLQL